MKAMQHAAEGWVLLIIDRCRVLPQCYAPLFWCSVNMLLVNPSFVNVDYRALIILRGTREQWPKPASYNPTPSYNKGRKSFQPTIDDRKRDRVAGCRRRVNFLGQISKRKFCRRKRFPASYTVHIFYNTETKKKKYEYIVPSSPMIIERTQYWFELESVNVLQFRMKMKKSGENCQNTRESIWKLRP